MDHSNLSTEIWKPVLGYEGLYEVSNQGRVKGLKRGKLLGVFLDPLRGYPKVVLHRNSIAKAVFVHRLVAGAFIGPLPEGKQVNHKDGTKTHNAPTNLEYVTPSENAKHAFAIGLWTSHPLKGEACNFAKLTEQEVIEIRSKLSQRIPATVLASMYHVSRQQIDRIRNRTTWVHVK
jgi:NUMOD4 motif-containing protein/HNH endonuclease